MFISSPSSRTQTYRDRQTEDGNNKVHIPLFTTGRFQNLTMYLKFDNLIQSSGRVISLWVSNLVTILLTSRYSFSQDFVHMSFKLQFYNVNSFSAKTLIGNVFVPTFSTRITSLTNKITKSMEQRPSWEAQLVQKFSAFNGTWRFITTVTRDQHLSLS